jgi:hypothetical protein
MLGLTGEIDVGMRILAHVVELLDNTILVEVRPFLGVKFVGK